MKDYVLVKPIYQPITYETKYTQYLNGIIKKALYDFTEQYTDIGILTKQGIISAFDDSLRKMVFSDKFVEAYFKSLGEYHNRKFNYVMKSATGVGSITQKISSHTTEQIIKTFIEDNIALIKTIEKRLHDQVFDIINSTTTDVDVDRQKIYEEIRSRFGVSKSNAKRIARDQSSKFIANMTEERHSQVGIKQYRWLGVGDRRERASHVENNNKIFSYSAPPASTGNPGNDVNCRCVTVGILSMAMVNHLKSLNGIFD